MTDDPVRAYAQEALALTAPGAPFGLREVQVAGRAFREYSGTDSNFAQVFLRAEAAFAARDLLVTPDGRISYSGLFGASRRLAAVLRDRYKIGTGDRVGVAMRNHAEWFVALAAIARLGATLVAFNSRGSSDELAYATSDVPCGAILVDDERERLLRHGGTTTRLMRLEEIAACFESSGDEVEAISVGEDDPAAILFTSGTTGRAKGAVLSQRNFTSTVRNMAFLRALNGQLAAGAAGVSMDQLRAASPLHTALLVYPMFHISGLMTFIQTIEAGGRLVLLRRWDAEAAAQAVVDNQVTALSGPPMIINDLLDQPNATERLRSVLSVGVGGQATPRSLADRVSRALPKVSQAAGWGMTETMGSLTTHSPATFLARPTSCGRPSPLVDLKVVDGEDREVAPGDAGEILARGVMTMSGYFNAPDATAAAFHGEWYRTGDVGFVDEDGFVYIVDRKKDMVISSGENIYCAEVEQVLNSDADVLEAILFGIPDERVGEAAIAAVNLRPGASRTAADLQQAVGTRLASYKVPADIAFDIGPFPRNATGKVNKAKVRELYLSKREAMILGQD